MSGLGVDGFTVYCEVECVAALGLGLVPHKHITWGNIYGAYDMWKNKSVLFLNLRKF